MRCESICRIARGADKCKIGVMWMNYEGYRDPTADKAVRKADKMPKHIRTIFDALNTVVSVQGINCLLYTSMGLSCTCIFYVRSTRQGITYRLTMILNISSRMT